MTVLIVNELAQWLGIASAGLLALYMLRLSREGAERDKEIRARLFGDGK